MYRLNKMLGADVSILRIYPVKNEAHARFSADARKYIYYVNFQKDPFAQEIEWLYPYHLDFEAMNQAAAVLFEFSDFTSFSKLHTQVKTNICRIDEAKWLVKGSKAEFHIKADRFLRNMVRAIVGTMIEVGLGRVSVDEFRKIIALKDRSRAGYSVPGKGLFLTDVIYPDGLQMQV
jgi:tRNA pseudouridine38-40 synthase